MSVLLNHTIVKCSDKHASARFLADLLGLPQPSTYGPFVVVEVDNEVNTADGGRGLYWDDPDGHVLEIITVPYGG